VTTLNYIDRAALGIMQPMLAKAMSWTALDYVNINFWFQVGYAAGYVLQGRFIDVVGVKCAFAIAVLYVKLPDKEPTLRVVSMPAGVNQYGDIFGGWIMSQVDIAGAIPAAQLACGLTATVAVNSFVLRQPILVRDLVSFYAEIAHVGWTAITVDVEVDVQRNPDDVICAKATEAGPMYVAVGPDRRPRLVAQKQVDQYKLTNKSRKCLSPSTTR